MTIATTSNGHSGRSTFPTHRVRLGQGRLGRADAFDEFGLSPCHRPEGKITPAQFMNNFVAYNAANA